MKILILTSIYPGPDVPKSYTPVVHFFTQQWVKMGHDVRVFHICNYYPRVFYFIPQWIRKIIESKKGFGMPEKRLDKELFHELDGVLVWRLPIEKTRPQKAFPERSLTSTLKRCKEILQEDSFSPDIIISHWVNPQAFLMSELKKNFACKSVMVLHDGGNAFSIMKDGQKLKEDIDVWGYRAQRVERNIREDLKITKPSFHCYSGIPDYYLEESPKRDWTKIDSFVFVGLLIERKHPELVISALHSIYVDNNFHLDIIGEGAMRSQLESQAKLLNCERCVTLTGRIDRRKIIEHLDEADVFVMISEAEVFGLVYLEAMARGCIAIASRGEGMEGIIIDGENGFLCNPGDENELTGIIQRIRTMNREALTLMSEKAKKTAANYTDTEAARHYIDCAINL